MNKTMIYIDACHRLAGIHEAYGLLCKLVPSKSELYLEKLIDLNNLESYCKDKLRLNELSDMLEKIRVAKENCKIKMNKYKQEENNG